jgi:molybdopterin molybdotransferase
MLTVAEARAAITRIPSLVRTEIVPLHRAQGRHLAEDIALAGDVPPFDRATMDGYAVMVPGGPDWTVVGQAHAGDPFTGALAPGQAVRILTGAPVPTGTTVIPQEVCRVAGGIVAVDGPVVPGRNIARCGEDGRAGQVAVPAGLCLGPATIAACAMAGRTTVQVTACPVVAVITTGDEVGGRGAGAIPDSNGPGLEALVQHLGLPVSRAHAGDDGVALRAALATALEAADVVVTTGGVGPGDKDLVPKLAVTLGFEVVFHRVAMQPGKPVYLACRSDGKVLVGLPGNPVSVLATGLIILVPILRRLQGLAEHPRDYAVLTAPMATKDRHLFLPGRRQPGGGVAPIPWNGSGDLLAAAAGDCLISAEPGQTLNVGTPVEVLPYLGTVMGQTANLLR